MNIPMRDASLRNRVLALIGVGAVLFVISGIGQAHGYWKSGPSWLGDIGYFGFAICLLLLVGIGVYSAVSALRSHHHRALPH